MASAWVLTAVLSMTRAASGLYPLQGPMAGEVHLMIEEALRIQARLDPLLGPARRFRLEPSCPARDNECLAKLAAAGKLKILFVGTLKERDSDVVILRLWAVLPDGRAWSPASAGISRTVTNSRSITNLVEYLARENAPDGLAAAAARPVQAETGFALKPTARGASSSPPPQQEFQRAGGSGRGAVAWVVAGSGAAVAVVGAVLLGVGQGTRADLQQKQLSQTLVESDIPRFRQAIVLSSLGVGLLAAGGAAALVGGYKLLPALGRGDELALGGGQIVYRTSF